MAGKRFQVVGPLAVVTVTGNVKRYIYEGGELPPEVTEKECTRLLDVGLIAEINDSGQLQTVGEPIQPLERAETPVSPFATGVRHGEAPTAPSEQPAGEDEGQQIERPTLVAPKEAWVDYATKRGMSREVAEAKSKREIIDAFPPE